MTNRWSLRKVGRWASLRRGGWALAALTLLPLTALAGMQFNADERIVVPTQNQINDSWYAAAQEMNITGHLLKHTFLAASQLTFAGMADQDLNLAFQLGNVSGSVGGDLRIVGDMVKISTRVGQNLVVVGRDVSVEPGVFVQDGLAVAGKKVLISGTVQGKTDLVGEDVEIDGTLLGDVVVRAKKFTLGEGAHINGKLTYAADQDVTLPAGVSAGQTQRLNNQPGETSGREWYTLFGKIPADKLFGVLFSATFLIVSLLLIWAWPKAAQSYGEAVGRSLWASLGWGLLLMLGIPLAVLLLTLSIVGIPLALLIVVVFLMGLFFSKLGVSCWLGGLLLFRMRNKKTLVFFLAGYALLLVVGLIPVLGTLVSWLSIIIGLGALVMVRRTAAPAPAVVSAPPLEATSSLPPAVPEPVAASAPVATGASLPQVKTVPVPRPMASKVVVPKRPMAATQTKAAGGRKTAIAKPKPVRKAVVKKVSRSTPKRRTR